MKRFLILAVFLALLIPATTNATIIYDSLTGYTAEGTDNATPTKWYAQSFTTDSTSYNLSSVSMLITMIGSSGSATVSIYTDASGTPDSSLGKLTLNSTGIPTTFTATGITLAANTTYWVVLGVSSGEFDWSYTKDYTGTYAVNKGSGWTAKSGGALMMQVTGTPVPLPGALLLFAPCMAGLALLKRRFIG